jgi:hypothetical protein
MNDDITLAIGYIFGLSLLLVIVVYYVGFKTDVQTFGASLNALILTLTGRNAQGQFAPYPSNQTTGNQSTGTTTTL